MRYILTLLILVLFVSVLGKPDAKPDPNPIVKITEKAVAATPPKVVETPKPVAPVPEPTPAPVAEPQVSTDCYAAMQRQWPKHLWAGAKIVIDKESSGRHAVIAPTNYNGSNDFGCFQINNHAHAAWFANHNWKDADQSAAYGYQLYKERGNWTAWYAVQGILW